MEVRRLFRRLRDRLSTPEEYARRIGVTIGKDCCIETRSWGSEPWLVEIGDHVHITSGVSFVTHDGGVWVFRTQIPGFDVFGRIKIRDNTYIGNDSMILPGVTIGRNCVIGARSVVNKSVPDGVVAAGVPIRFVRTTAEYRERMLPLDLGTKQMPQAEKRRATMLMPREKEIRKAALRTTE